MGAALITGGAKRLGRAMALRLAQRGLDVVIHFDSSKDTAEETAADARKFGVNATTLQADLIDDADIEGLVGRARDALEKPLTVLVNNASIFEYDNITTATMASWDRHIGSNLKAPFFLTQAFAAQAPDAEIDAGGEPRALANVINMVDQRVRKLTPEFMTYSLAKSALWALTQTTAQALAPHIRVNGIAPGPTMIGHRQTAEHFANQRKKTILQRGSNPDEICNTLEFILDSDGMTGQLICLDGGQHLAWETPDIQGIE